MSKTQSKTHSAAWKVTGRGKSRQFLAALPAQSASAGDRVRLESKAGVITTGVLLEMHDSSDGLECWTFQKDSKTPEQLASDRSKRAAATASYWSSEAGQQTAERIAERNRKRAEQSEQLESKPASKPAASKPQSASKPAPNSQPAAGSGVQLAELLAQLIGAGMDAATAAATATATLAQLESKPAASKPASKPQSSKPQSKPAPATGAECCEICGDKRRKVTALRQLDGATLDSCARCVSLDDDTARIRAQRTASK